VKIVKIVKHGPQRWSATHLSPPELLRITVSAARGWNDDNALRLGAALSFYSLLSFPPLLIVTISIAGLLFGRDAARTGLLHQISQLIGKSGSEMFDQMIRAASRPGHGLVATAIGLVFVLFGATSVFAELRDALNLIWKV
jgi:membrane protein